jgi:hypothetical protein
VDAVADQTAAPWHPKGAKVPESIKQAHKDKQVRNERTRTLAPGAVFKRQEFAKAYLIDCDPTMAALRCGLVDSEDEDSHNEARRVGWYYFRQPETLAAIQAFSATMENDKIVSRERVLMGLLEEANYRGLGASHSARVAAWSKIAQMLGAEKPKGEEDPATKVKGGVMMIPMAQSIEQWETVATGSQAALKSAVRQ